MVQSGLGKEINLSHWSLLLFYFRGGSDAGAFPSGEIIAQFAPIFFGDGSELCDEVGMFIFYVERFAGVRPEVIQCQPHGVAGIFAWPAISADGGRSFIGLGNAWEDELPLSFSHGFETISIIIIN